MVRIERRHANTTRMRAIELPFAKDAPCRRAGLCSFIVSEDAFAAPLPLVRGEPEGNFLCTRAAQKFRSASAEEPHRTSR
ncbi:hypothetical protein MTO96_003637 [Rhipicephalus appendiculatus]